MNDGDDGDGSRFDIGVAAARSGVSATMARDDESLGLLPPVASSDAGDRRDGQPDELTGPAKTRR